jgi:hypothetical protein
MPTLNVPRHSSPNLIGQPSVQAGLSPIVLANSHTVIASKLTAPDDVDFDPGFLIMESFFPIVEFLSSFSILCIVGTALLVYPE